MTLAVKVALNLNTTNQLLSQEKVLCWNTIEIKMNKTQI